MHTDNFAEEEIRKIAARPIGSAPLLIFGAPGTGKTTVLRERAAELINSGSLNVTQMLILSPTRRAAADLRDSIARLLRRSFSGALARTWSSYAFDVLNRAWLAGLLPWVKSRPRLLSGAEQDAIIKELLAGHGQEGIKAIAWPENFEQALATKAFRTEIRSFFDRINEYRLTAEEVVGYARQYHKPVWESLAKLYQEYNSIIALRSPEAFDPSAIIGQAHRILEENPDFLREEKQKITNIMVDDAHECNAGVFEFIDLLAENKDAMFTACPPATVHGFRGARPDLVKNLGNLGKLETVTLRQGFRLDSAMTEAYRNVGSRTGGVYGTKQCLDVDSAVSEGDGCTSSSRSITSHIVATDVQELRFIAERLTSRCITNRTPYRNMAVVARHGTMLHTISRFLETQEIPHNLAAAETVLSHEPIVQELLDIYYFAMSPEHRLSPTETVAMLTSSFGGADALGIRRLKQFLKTEHRAASFRGGVSVSKTGDELLTQLLADLIDGPDKLFMYGPHAADVLKPVQRIASMIHKARQKIKHATVHEFLWALWDASENPRIWKRQALNDATPAKIRFRAHKNLDTMVELFTLAERFTQHVAVGSVQAFYERLSSQDLVEDTLAQRPYNNAVFLATPATVAGKEFDYVIVAGVQEGVWPNLKIRGEIFDISNFSAAVENSYVGPSRKAGGSASREELRQALKTVRHDELRTFSTAISRARYAVDIVAVSNEQTQASYFLDLVDPYEGASKADLARPLTTVNPPMTLRSLTGQLRKRAQEGLEGSDETSEKNASVAAAALAYIGRFLEEHKLRPRGITPEDWWGLLPVSSTAPLIAEGEVPVSPSNLQLVHDSPFIWLMQAVGARSLDDEARRLGLFIHAIAEELPEGNFEQYQKMLDREWKNLVSTRRWQARKERDYAERMLNKLSEYNRIVKREGRNIAGVEQKFDYAVGRARLRGVMDRVYRGPNGKKYIIDFKTGKTAQSKQEVQENLQLAAYQLAVENIEEGASAGAELVYLGTGAKGVVVRAQSPIVKLQQEAPWVESLIHEAAELMAAACFEARHHPQRMHSKVFNILCPLCPEGKQVTEVDEEWDA